MTVIKQPKWSDAAPGINTKIARNQRRAKSTAAHEAGSLSVRGSGENVACYWNGERLADDVEMRMPARMFAAHMALASIEARQAQEQVDRSKRTKKLIQLYRDQDGRIAGAVSVDSD